MPGKRSRVEKWNDVLESIEKFDKFRETKEAKLKSWVRKGIPEECKGRAWQFLSGSVRTLVPGRFAQLVSATLPATVVAAIQVDLPRTFPKIPHFQKPTERERIRRVLHAYAAHDAAVGYVQGMAFVTGALLFYMGEEEAFWMLTTLMHKYNYHNALIQDFPFVRLCLAQLQHVIRKFTPALHLRLHRNGGPPCVPVELFSGAFVALLADAVPWDLFTRVWDSFFFEEWKTIFRLIVALLQHHEARLVAIQDDGELIGSMKFARLAEGLDVGQLMEKAFNVKLRSKTLYRVCKRYNRDKFEEWMARLDLEGLARVMQHAETGVEVADRTQYLRKYPSCFVAREAVDWLVAYIGQGKLNRHCGACHPDGLPQAPPLPLSASVPGFAGLALTFDLTAPKERGIPAPVVDFTSAALRTPPLLPTAPSGPLALPDRHYPNSALSLGASDAERDSDASDPFGGSPSRGSLPLPLSQPPDVAGPDAPDEDEEEEEDGEEMEPASLCWCRAHLGATTAYFLRYVNDHKAKVESLQRKKAVIILTAMEQKGLLHAVKASEEPISGDATRLFRFGPAPPP